VLPGYSELNVAEPDPALPLHAEVGMEGRLMTA